ncbi:MAG: glycogen synthase [Myxococcaceae bacterium]|nr:glycogen synthase [Myxococcaceae bacterium]
MQSAADAALRCGIITLPMRLLYLTSEMAPFAKTGGLADVMGALPKQLHRMGHNVQVFLPAYASIDRKKYPFQKADGLEPLDLSLGQHRYRITYATVQVPGSSLRVHLVQCPALYGRPGIYSSAPDEHRRFLALSYAALEACRQVGFAPDVVHCNDWQTALVPMALKTIYARDPVLGRARSLLTIHNLMYQGAFPGDVVNDTRLMPAVDRFHQDQLKAGVVNFLLHGVLYADGITTVSPTYSREIQTPEHGAGLDHLLRQRSSTVVGVLNGVDYSEWSPETDRLIPHHFSADDLSGKERDKEVLLGKLGLPYQPGVPVLGVVSRLASQKGLDLLLDVIPWVLQRHGVQLVVLGNGDKRLAGRFTTLQHTFPRQVCFYEGFSNELAHLIEAGADIFLMPSRYEPCGLNQLYSLRYGTVPVVHKTGGLADSVQLFDPRTGTGTGFPFDQHDQPGLRWGIEAALRVYQDRPAWRQLQKNGMAQDFSWEKQARLYERLYAQIQG